MIEEFALGTSRVYRIPLVESGRDGERAAVSRLVARAFGSDARLLHAPNGRPYVEGGAGGGERFISVSHGAGMALLAVNARRRIGIDVEAPRMQLHARRRGCRVGRLDGSPACGVDGEGGRLQGFVDGWRCFGRNTIACRRRRRIRLV